jgi:diketogulonate reductase-like aldo/keto reductase
MERTADQVSLAWTLTRPAVSSLVVGGLSEEQFRDNIAAVDLKLTDAELETLNQVSRPPCIYPYWHQHNFAGDRFNAGDRALHDNYADVGAM